MLSRIFSNPIKALSNVEITGKISKDELTTAYIFVQSFRLLATMVWVFSIIVSYFIGSTLNQQSTLFEWSVNHKYLVMLTLVFFSLCTSNHHVCYVLTDRIYRPSLV